jgi:hypothetical protein
MKKLAQIFIVMVLVFVLAAGAFLTTYGPIQPPNRIVCPNVGWNTRMPACGSVAYQIWTPGLEPYVGWNT